MIDVTCNSKNEYNLTSLSCAMKMTSKSITTYDRSDQSQRLVIILDQPLLILGI